MDDLLKLRQQYPLVLGLRRASIDDFIACIVGAAFVLAIMSSGALAEMTEDLGPVETVTRIYARELGGISASTGQKKAREPFFSDSLAALREENRALCLTKSRGDDMCGFGADGDIFLNAQESGPQLNFKSSEFSAKSSGPGVVDVSFTVWPGERDYYRRQIRFIMVDDAGSWRIDDIIYGPNAGPFHTVSSMRRAITDENAAVSREANELSEIWSWINIYLQSNPDRFAKFVRFPLEACTSRDGCVFIERKDAEFAALVQELHERIKASREAVSVKSDWGKNESLSPREGDSIRRDVFDFIYRDSAWWVKKIDLRRRAR